VISFFVILNPLGAMKDPSFLPEQKGDEESLGMSGYELEYQRLHLFTNVGAAICFTSDTGFKVGGLISTGLQGIGPEILHPSAVM
jgi:hypothetical protein